MSYTYQQKLGIHLNNKNIEENSKETFEKSQCKKLQNSFKNIFPSLQLSNDSTKDALQFIVQFDEHFHCDNYDYTIRSFFDDINRKYKTKWCISSIQRSQQSFIRYNEGVMETYTIKLCHTSNPQGPEEHLPFW
jgi:hypothetical protein